MGVFDMGRRAWAAPRATVPRAVMARRLESCTDIEGEALPSQSVAATAAASPAASAQSSLPSPGASRPLLASLPSAQSPSPEPVPSSVPASLPSLSGVRSGDGGGGEELLRRRGAAEAGPRTRFTSLHAVIVILLLACALCASLTMLVRQSMNYHAVHGQGVGSGQRATEPRRTGEGAGSKASADSAGTGAHAGTGAGADAPAGETAQPSATPNPDPSTTAAPAAGSPATAAPGNGALDLNAASAQDLEAIAHIGPVTAQRILDYRRSIGRFSSVDQLLDVKGIGAKTLEKIRPHLRVS